MKKLLSLLLCALLCASMASFAAAEDAVASIDPADFAQFTGATIDAIKAKGTLVLGTEATYPPFEFLDGDANFAGCDIWLGEQIALALGVKLEVMDMAFDGIISAVKANQVDIGIAAFTVTEERALEIDFSEIYQRDEQMLVVKKGNEDVYATKDSLKGLQVGAQRGTVQSLLIQSALPDSILFELDKYPALALEVVNGNIAGLVVDGAVGESLIASNDGLAQSNFAFDPEEAKFGKAAVLAKGTDDLRALV
ncbi:MAG: transporter substrate-binding domain-containing protein, partial [Clostridiales bacterium]|nr:transporter substrate-binding domain-containing protein [Clostridiales bacterium]